MAKGLWPVLNVASVEKSVEFYKGLGLKATLDRMPAEAGMPALPFGVVDLGESGLVLWGKDNVAPDQAPDTKAWLSGELGKGVLFTVGVPNARKTWEKAQKLRAQVDAPLGAQPWGGHGFNVVDVDGYVLNVTDKFPGPPEPARKKAASSARAEDKPRRNAAARKAKAPARKPARKAKAAKARTARRR